MPPPEMAPVDRIYSFARKRCPRAILTRLLDGDLHLLKDLCIVKGEMPFCDKTARYWLRMLVRFGYVQGVINLQIDGRYKLYRIPQGMKEPVEDLLRRIPEEKPDA